MLCVLLEFFSHILDLLGLNYLLLSSQNGKEVRLYMSNQIVKTLAVLGVLGCLDSVCIKAANDSGNDVA